MFPWKCVCWSPDPQSQHVARSGDKTLKRLLNYTEVIRLGLNPMTGVLS